MVDVIFAINDPKRGPTALFYESTSPDKDSSLPLKVAIKSQLTLSLMDRDAVVSQSDAVLPFPDISKISFSFLFTLKHESGSNITASISYLVPQSENISLYRKIPSLKERMIQTAKSFQNWTYKSDTPLPKQFFDVLNGILNFEKADTTTQVKTKFEITSERASGTPDYLLKKIKKNLEFVLFDLFVEKIIIVTGKSKIAVEYAIASLDFLTPHRELKKIIFSEEYVDPTSLPEKVDIIGVSSNFDKNYLKEFVVIDVDKFEVKGNLKGNKSYFKDFIQKIKNLDSVTIQQDLQIFVSNLLETTHAITDFFASHENYDKNAIKDLTANMKTDEKEAVIEVSASYNPLIAEKIRTNLASKVSGWLDDFT